MNKLVTWVNRRIEKENWSIRELSRRAGLSHTAVYKTLNGTNAVTWDFCLAMSHVFDLSPESLFRMADLLPPIPNEGKVHELCELAKVLLESDLDEVLFYARYRHQRSRGIS